MTSVVAVPLAAPEPQGHDEIGPLPTVAILIRLGDLATAVDAMQFRQNAIPLSMGIAYADQGGFFTVLSP